MIIKYCDICGESESENPINKISYYGIELDICRECRELFNKNFEDRLSSLLNEVKKDIRKVRGIKE